MKILEIGCGKNPYKPKEREKVVHLDKIKLPDVEIVWNLNKFPYPFKDNEFDVIIAKHVIEHLDNIIKVMEELWKILKPNGLLKITVPYAKHTSAFQNPTHKHFFTCFTFDYRDSEGYAKNLFYELKTKAKFKIVKKELRFPWPYKFIKLVLKFRRGWNFMKLCFQEFFLL